MNIISTLDKSTLLTPQLPQHMESKTRLFINPKDDAILFSMKEEVNWGLLEKVVEVRRLVKRIVETPVGMQVSW